MKIELTSFVDAGDLENERIGFKVKQSCNLKFLPYIIHQKLNRDFIIVPNMSSGFTPKQFKRVTK